jgi:hypothetical protein
MKRSTMIALAGAAMILAVSPAYCATYYVATTGLDTNGGTFGAPFKTINKAVGMAVGGDIIYMRGGTYTYTGSSNPVSLSTRTGASSTNRCSLIGYNGERPLLDFSAMTGTGADGVKLSGNYWYVKGLDFKGAPHNGMKISGSYNIVEFCSSYENRNSGVQLETGASYNQIINCDSYYNCDAPEGGNADGFAPKMDVGTGNYFYGCRSWQNSDDAYDGYLRGADDVTTTYENCWAFKAGYLKDGSPITTGNGNGFKMGGCDADVNGEKHLRHNAILKNCLAFGNRSRGFDQNSDKGSMTLYNCTAFGNAGSNFGISTFPLEAGKTATVINGVSYTGGSVSLGSSVVQATNSWSGGFTVTSADFLGIDPSAAYGPRQADGSLPDISFMHLAAGSDLIDRGTIVGLPYYGTKPDLGAFEVVVNDSTSPTPNPMTFAAAPYYTSSTSVAMVASTATDNAGVEYMFACTSGGGHSSDWQTGTTYTDTGLTPEVTYSYTVTARDRSASHNMTGTSPAASVTTPGDMIAPTPNPMTFSIAPYAVSSTSVAMVASTANDVSGVEYMFTCVVGAGHSSGWQDDAAYTDSGLAPETMYAYTVRARDKSALANTTAASGASSAWTWTDSSIPTPSPMTWANVPYATGPTSITMVATTASDIAGVQYYFHCTTAGGHDSAWQDSSTYTDVNLMPSSLYTYQVKARDKSVSQNETTYSEAASAMTADDNAAPMPNPMSWAAQPSATGTDSITMTATTASDLSGVEYFFANVTDASHNSGWQDGASYTDTGLVNNKTYVYRVIARDKSTAHNETAWSGEASATTIRFICTGSIASDLDSNCQVDFMDYALMAAAWSTPLPLTNNMAANGTFDAGVTPGWEQLDLSTAAGTLMTGFDPPYGNPPGAAYLMCDTSGGDVAGHYFYQVLSVTPGSWYRFSGEWMGDLTGGVSPDPLTMSSNAEVTIAFESSSDPATWDLSDPALVKYGKVWGIGNQNTDPNGTWAWEVIAQSRTNAPADDVYAATAQYMVIAFSQGGIAGSGMPWIDIDNIKVEGPGCPALDLTSDCKLDWQDMQKFVADWLACNRNPAGECWQ